MNDIFSACPSCGSEDITITTGALKSRLVCSNCPQDLTYYSQMNKVRDRDERRALIRLLIANTRMEDETIHDLINLYNKMNLTSRDTDFLDKLLTTPVKRTIKKKNPEKYAKAVTASDILLAVQQDAHEANEQLSDSQHMA